MAEGLGVAASAISIATAAIQSVQFLSKTIDNIKDVPKTVKSVRVDLQAVEPILHQLDKALQNDESQVVLRDEIKPVVQNCDRACTSFQAALDRWMRHSTEEKTFWMDRWRVGLFGQDRITTFKGQLNDCKSTLNVALSTATMYVSSPGIRI
jgi:hypothetical protein